MISRVEGEGALTVKIKNGAVNDLQFRIFEPPRFFEAFLRDRKYSEAPDITARICGICPVAYQMSAVHAMENLFGVTMEGQLRELRRLLYCGEWIESHALHIYMLHAPDFLGCEDVFEVAKIHPEIVKNALRLKKAGNDIVNLLGGREIHPINVRVGGFYRLPSRRELMTLVEDLQWARDFSMQTVRWTSTLEYPDFEQDYEFVSLRHASEYPFNEGRIVSNKGLDIEVKEYEFYFHEHHVAHSNALHSTLRERGAYFVGPLARFNLNFERLTPDVQELAREIGAVPPINNPFKSIIVRALETFYACEEALRIIGSYEPPPDPCPAFTLHPGLGFACTEAPRGILYHRYRIGDHGTIVDAKIVPPTAQNQRTIENDLRAFVTKNIALPKDELTWKCEQAIRNYDPCISCATHFLDLRIEE